MVLQKKSSRQIAEEFAVTIPNDKMLECLKDINSYRATGLIQEHSYVFDIQKQLTRILFPDDSNICEFEPSFPFVVDILMHEMANRYARSQGVNLLNALDDEGADVCEDCGDYARFGYSRELIEKTMQRAET